MKIGKWQKKMKPFFLCVAKNGLKNNIVHQGIPHCGNDKARRGKQLTAFGANEGF